MSIKFQDPPQLNVSEADMLRMIAQGVDSGSYGVFAAVEPCKITQADDGTFDIYFRMKEVDPPAPLRAA